MSLNKVSLIGNLGKDPEVRHFDNGSCVASFTLATTERGYTAKDGTAVPERTEWHNCVLWNGLASVAEKYLRKGSKVYLEGKLRTRSYDKDGQVRYVTEVVADNMEMLSAPPQPQQPAAPLPPPAPAPQPAAAPVQTSFVGNDGLPF
jgi:single-strand DNA-binding protein